MSDGESFLSGASFLTDAGHHRSLSLAAAYPTPAEMYKATKGISSDWGIPGYDIPHKPATYRSPSFKVTKTKRTTVFDEVEKRSKDPDPTKYQADLTKVAIDRKHRPTYRAKRNTYVDMIFKTGSLSPGPGTHYPPDARKTEGDKKKSRGLSFNKADGASFLSEIAYQSLESPGAGQYFQEGKGPAKQLSASLRNNYFFMKSPTRPTKESLLGPGVYHHVDYVTDPKKEKLKPDPLHTTAPRPIMPKSKRVSVLELAAKQHKDVPGIGSYPDAMKTLECFPSDLKKVHFYAAKSKGPRFPETHIRSGSSAPGPGHYNYEDREEMLRKRA